MEVKTKLVSIFKNAQKGNEGRGRPQLKVDVGGETEAGPSSALGNGSGPSISLPRAHPRPSDDLNRNDSSSDNVWQGICVKVLPLVNGEEMRSSIEEMNEQVGLYIKRTLDRSPGHAPEIILNDLRSLVATGMLTLGSRVSDDGEDLIPKILSIWDFFHGRFLITFSAVFLPIERDGRLRELLTIAKSGRGLGKKTDPVKDSFSTASLPFTGPYLPQGLDVRKIALAVFRNIILYPRASSLERAFETIFRDFDPKRDRQRQQWQGLTSKTASPTTPNSPSSASSAPALLRMVAILSYAQTAESPASPQAEFVKRLLEIIRRQRQRHDETTTTTTTSSSRSSIGERRGSLETL